MAKSSQRLSGLASGSTRQRVQKAGMRSRSRRSSGQNDALVLSLLKAADRPVSAYDIVDLASRSGTRLVANQVYRTIARLIGQRMVKRIETLNAYVSAGTGADLCLVCSRCRGVDLVEAPALIRSLRQSIMDARFDHAGGLVEVSGLCADCRPPGVGEPESESAQNAGFVRGSTH